MKNVRVALYGSIAGNILKRITLISIGIIFTILPVKSFLFKDGNNNNDSDAYVLMQFQYSALIKVKLTTAFNSDIFHIALY